MCSAKSQSHQDNTQLQGSSGKENADYARAQSAISCSVRRPSPTHVWEKPITPLRPRVHACIDRPAEPDFSHGARDSWHALANIYRGAGAFT